MLRYRAPEVTFLETIRRDQRFTTTDVEPVADYDVAAAKTQLIKGAQARITETYLVGAKEIGAGATDLNLLRTKSPRSQEYLQRLLTARKGAVARTKIMLEQRAVIGAPQAIGATMRAASYRVLGAPAVRPTSRTAQLFRQSVYGRRGGIEFQALRVKGAPTPPTATKFLRIPAARIAKRRTRGHIQAIKTLLAGAQTHEGVVKQLNVGVGPQTVVAPSAAKYLTGGRSPLLRAPRLQFTRGQVINRRRLKFMNPAVALESKVGTFTRLFARRLLRKSLRPSISRFQRLLLEKKIKDLTPAGSGNATTATRDPRTQPWTTVRASSESKVKGRSRR